MKVVFLIGVSFLTIVSFYGVSSLKCYQCNSAMDDNCEDLKGEEYLLECGKDGQLKDSSAYKVCRKLDQWVDFEVLDNKPFKRVLRQCGIEKDPKICQYKAGFGGRVNTCECEEDGCNGASTLTILPIILVSTLALAFYARS